MKSHFVLHHILLLSTFLMFQTLSAFSNTNHQSARHFYVEWQHWNNNIVLGSFASNDKKRIPFLTKSIHDINKDDIDHWLGRSDAAILLFHAMWGQQKSFHKSFIGSIDKAISTNPLPYQQQDIISFLWHAGGVMYRNNWELAYGKGEALAPLVTLISKNYSQPVDVLCHSMGNRFFEGTVSKMDTGKHFRSITFFSADIASNSDDVSFQKCLYAANNIYVYIHKKDRLLWASSMLHGVDRLGKTGPTPPLPNISVTDMTNDTRSFSNHSNFNAAWVQRKLNEQWRMEPSAIATIN